jgi:hypothetical protein
VAPTVGTVSFNADFMGSFLTMGPPHDFTFKGERERKTLSEKENFAGPYCNTVIRLDCNTAFHSEVQLVMLLCYPLNLLAHHRLHWDGGVQCSRTND